MLGYADTVTHMSRRARSLPKLGPKRATETHTGFASTLLYNQYNFTTLSKRLVR